MQQISLYLTSIILGIMLFFSFVVAPVTFTALNEENARKFIRKIFPYYYTVNLAISILVLICFTILKIFSLDFYLILSVAALFAVSNFILMPLINKYRDEKQDNKFKYSHFISVVINFIRMKLITTEIKCEYLNLLSCFSSLYLFISGISIKLDTANNAATLKIK